eukprot:gene2209-2412_t
MTLMKTEWVSVNFAQKKRLLEDNADEDDDNMSRGSDDKLCDLLSGSTSSCSSVDDQPKKQSKIVTDEVRERRNARRRKHYYLIRIPREDVRRQIPQMVANVVNNCNMDLLSSFLQRFCRGDCCLIDIAHNKLNPFSDHSYINFVHGLDRIANFIMSFSQLTPDLYMRINFSQLRYGPLHSTVIVHYSLIGTAFYRPKMHEINRRLNQLLDAGNAVVQSDQGPVAIGPQADEVNEILRQRMSEPYDWREGAIPVSNPVSFESGGYLIVRMDQDGVIQGLDLLGERFSPEHYIQPSLHLPISARPQRSSTEA